MRFRAGILCLCLALAATRPRPVLAQTAADSAQAILEAAQVLERDGRTELARELLRYLRQRWPDSPAARAARDRIEALPAAPLSPFGRTSFIAYHTLYGAFLGVAIPAALGAEDPEPFGAGLLLGAPLGFFASRAWGRSRPLTDGQAGVVQFGSFWGGWLGFALQSVLDLGEETICDGDVCFFDTPATARWTAGVVGSVAGLSAGLLAARRPIAGGTSSLIFHGSLWGTWYGVAAGIFTDAEDDDLLTAALIGGNAGLLLAIPMARVGRPTSSRVRIASAGGLAGGLAGLGTVLLFSIEGDKAVIATTAASVTLGLILGASLGKDGLHRADGGPLLLAPALVSGDGPLRLGLPLPVPARLPAESGRITTGWRLSLLDARF